MITYRLQHQCGRSDEGVDAIGDEGRDECLCL